MKKLFSLIALFIGLSVSAQNRLVHDYQQWNVRNFRSCPDFKVQVSLSEVNPRILNAAVFWVTNEQRLRDGKTILNYNEALETSAFFHAKYMFDTKKITHENRDDFSRRSPGNRAGLAGVENPYIAENCLYFTDYDAPYSYLKLAEKIVGMWMKSPPHKANILSEKGLEMGCGIYTQKNIVWGTQNFQWFEPVIYNKLKASDEMNIK